MSDSFLGRAVMAAEREIFNINDCGLYKSKLFSFRSVLNEIKWARYEFQFKSIQLHKKCAL